MAALGVAAFGNVGEHDRTGYEGRWGDLPGVAGDAGLHLQLLGLGDDHLRGDLLPFLLGALDAVARVANAVAVLAAVG